MCLVGPNMNGLEKNNKRKKVNPCVLFNYF